MLKRVFYLITNFSLLFLKGVIDSCSLYYLYFLLRSSRKLRHTLFKSILLNGVVFLSSILIIDNFLNELILFILPVNTRDSTINTINSYFVNGINYTFYLLWIYPIYCISALLCTFWNKDVATETYYTFYKKKEERQSFTAILKIAAGEIYNVLTTTVFLGQIILLSKIPYVGNFLFIINTAWYYSLTSFDFKWSFSGISIINRILLCELHWEYMLGFGIIPAILTNILPKYVATAILAFLTPFFIILAILAPAENSSFSSTIEENKDDKIEKRNIPNKEQNFMERDKTLVLGYDEDWIKEQTGNFRETEEIQRRVKFTIPEYIYPIEDGKNLTYPISNYGEEKVGHISNSQIKKNISENSLISLSGKRNKKYSLPIFKIVKIFNLLLLRFCNRICKRKVKKLTKEK